MKIHNWSLCFPLWVLWSAFFLQALAQVLDIFKFCLWGRFFWWGTSMAVLRRDMSIKVQLFLWHCIVLSVFFCSVSGRGILSGHADGTIVRFFFDDEGSGESQVSKILLQRAEFLFAQPPSQLWAEFLFAQPPSQLQSSERDQAVEGVDIWRGAAGCAC